MQGPKAWTPTPDSGEHFNWSGERGATSNSEGLPKHRAEGTLSGGTQVAEGLAKDSMVNEDGSGSPGWQLAGCRARVTGLPQ